MKRCRVSAIVSSVDSGSLHSMDLDVQSNMSSESGYQSQGENHTGSGSINSVKKKRCLVDQSSTESDEPMIKIEADHDPAAMSQFIKMSVPRLDSQLLLPLMASSANKVQTGMHMGVAYLGMIDSCSQNGIGCAKDMKMGLVPMVASQKGMYPFSVNGLSALDSSGLPEGVKPLFLTSMPGGFMMKETDCVMESDKLSQTNSMSASSGRGSSLGKHKSNQNGSQTLSNGQNKKFVTKESEAEFIEHYTNGMFEYLGHLGRARSSDSYSMTSCSMKSGSSGDTDGMSSVKENNADLTYDNKYPMVCGICNDRATGLHYGIITCEGYVDLFTVVCEVFMCEKKRF